jgi:hypothetical protein
MGGGVQAQLSSFAAAHTDGLGADCCKNRLNPEQNSLKVPNFFACGAFFFAYGVESEKGSSTHP